MEITSGQTIEGLDALIAALTILRKYGNPKFPTHCEHDIMRVCIDPEKVSAEDRNQLDRLSFHVDEEGECFSSYRYGSA